LEGSAGAYYQLLESDYWVIHCGHPTAHFPYYGQVPSGERIVAPNGRGFQTLFAAQAAVLDHYLSEHIAQKVR